MDGPFRKCIHLTLPLAKMPTRIKRSTPHLSIKQVHLLARVSSQCSSTVIYTTTNLVNLLQDNKYAKITDNINTESG